MPRARYKVLVMGEDTRSFLACVRSLGRQGIEVHAAPYTLGSAALASRYIQRTHLLPYYVDDGEDWLLAMQALLEREQFDMVLPCEERSLLPLVKHRAVLPGQAVLAVPGVEALSVFFDKWLTRETARSARVPVAEAVRLTATDTVDTILQRLQLPVVAKHTQSYSWPDLYKRTQVTPLRNRQELEAWLGSQTEHQDLFIEEMLAGTGLGVSVLSRDGVVLQAFEHHRANELAGSSYYRKSMPLDPERLACVERMCEAVKYTGLAMFEFKLNPSGRWILLEVNARPWGSLPLPVAWGVDFPYMLFRTLCLGETPSAVNYPSPRYARNFLADMWQLRLYGASVPGKPVHFAVHTLKWLLGLSRVLINRERHDVWTWDDVKPALIEMKLFLQARWQTVDRLTGLPPVGSPQSVTNRLRNRPPSSAPIHLVFLCQGNVCRSPYAEHKARQLLMQQGLDAFVSSAGLLPRNARPSPSQAIDAAAAAGVDLSTHRSRHAHLRHLESADIIVIFDHINHRALCERHPQLAQRAVYLSSYVEPALGDIEDPDGRPLAEFEMNYRTIDRCLVELVSSLSRLTTPQKIHAETGQAHTS